MNKRCDGRPKRGKIILTRMIRTHAPSRAVSIARHVRIHDAIVTIDAGTERSRRRRIESSNVAQVVLVNK